MGEAAEQLAEELRSGAALGNYKSALQERLAGGAGRNAGVQGQRAKAAPTIASAFWSRSGSKLMRGRAGKPLARGMGSTKKHAEQDAARRALERLRRRRRQAATGSSRTPGAKKEEAGSAMSTPAGVRRVPGSAASSVRSRLRLHLPTVPEALASLLRPWWWRCFCSPLCCSPTSFPRRAWSTRCWWAIFCWSTSRSMRPAGSLSRWLLPYRDVARGDIVVFHHPAAALSGQARGGHSRRPAAHRGWPGDGERRRAGRALRGLRAGRPIPSATTFPPGLYRSAGRSRLVEADAEPHRDGELVVPQGEYFVLGDNRNHSKDSRFWGFVPRQADCGPPLVIYFSLTRPFDHRCRAGSTLQAADDRLGHDRELSARLTGFARWKRIFHVVH
jgi:signal peptidase I